MDKVLNQDILNKVKILFSDRVTAIGRQFRSEHWALELQSGEETRNDVHRFISAQVGDWCTNGAIPWQHQTEIEETFMEISEGNFLQAALAWKTFHSGVTYWSPQVIKARLEGLRKISKEATAYYCSLLERIPEDSQQIAKQGFIWVLGSCKPLNVLELQHAVAIGAGQRSWAVKACIILSFRDFVRLRDIAQEALKDEIRDFLAKSLRGHDGLAGLNYSRYDDEDSGEDIPGSELDVGASLKLQVDQETGGLDKHSLFSYCVAYWNYHCSQGGSSAEVVKSLTQFALLRQSHFFHLVAMLLGKAKVYKGAPWIHIDQFARVPPLHFIMRVGDHPFVVQNLIDQRSGHKRYRCQWLDSIDLGRSPRPSRVVGTLVGTARNVAEPSLPRAQSGHTSSPCL